jgi:hypothetical protein
MSPSIDRDRRRWLGAGVIAMAGLPFGIFPRVGRDRADDDRASAGTGELASLRSATAWFNTRPLTATDVRGKIVLIDVWTYTCVNWLRTLPYVRAWSNRYTEHGLVVIGVHAPEFPFEHDLANVGEAVKTLDVPYAVAVDNEFTIWRAFENNYWPALYLLDGEGRIRYRHFGEGEYEETERNLQRLLNGAGARGVGSDLVSVSASGVEAAADWRHLKSPENYVGYGRTDGFVSSGPIAFDQRHGYSDPPELRLNGWALSGNWTIRQGDISLNAPNGKIAYCFHARDLNLVMGPAVRGARIRFRVLIDGHPPAAAHGVDADVWGNGTVVGQRMYQLIRQTGPIADRRFEIEFLDPGLAAFCFTFG